MGGEHLGTKIHLREKRREFHFLPHVDIIVRGAAVGTERDAAARVRHRLGAENAACELHVGRRIVREGRAALREDFNIGVGEMHAVRKH